MQANIMNNAGHTPTDLVENCKGFYSMVRLVLKLYASGAQFQPQRQDYIDKRNVQDIMKWRETTSKKSGCCFNTCGNNCLCFPYSGHLLCGHFSHGNNTTSLWESFKVSTLVARLHGLTLWLSLNSMVYSGGDEYGMYILTTLLSILAMPGSFTSIVKFLIGAPKERQRHTKRQISRQYPFAIFYIVNAVLFVIINSLAMASFEVARNLSY
uniref:Uncharacterized protein n=1 Tax=Oryza meridionalis TaxID=40149 RepID=A0A0E0F5C0_9ORYZ